VSTAIIGDLFNLGYFVSAIRGLCCCGWNIDRRVVDEAVQIAGNLRQPSSMHGASLVPTLGFWSNLSEKGWAIGTKNRSILSRKK
jgi:hypothetical protein